MARKVAVKVHIITQLAEVCFSKPERQTLLLSSPRYPAESLRANGFIAEHEHFIECIMGNRRPRSNLADAVKTMEIMDRMRESNRLGASVHVGI